MNESSDQKPPIQITWKGVRVTAKSKLGEKDILQNVTGGIRPGEFLAIMGPSGAGKTTFLNCIMNRSLGKNVTRTDGTISYNIHDINDLDVKLYSGFVP